MAGVALWVFVLVSVTTCPELPPNSVPLIPPHTHAQESRNRLTHPCGGTRARMKACTGFSHFASWCEDGTGLSATAATVKDHHQTWIIPKGPKSSCMFLPVKAQQNWSLPSSLPLPLRRRVPPPPLRGMARATTASAAHLGPAPWRAGPGTRWPRRPSALLATPGGSSRASLTRPIAAPSSLRRPTSGSLFDAFLT